MNMTKKRVAELEGAQLDWAVEKAESGARLVNYAGHYVPMPLDCVLPYSSDWCNGGPIIERERICLEFLQPGIWHAYPRTEKGMNTVAAGKAWSIYCEKIIGHTPLIAAMRAFVALKLDDEVEVPE